MVKTSATPKVSYVKPTAADEPIKTKAQTVGGDAYTTCSSDSYSSLINGKPKAEAIEGGVISEIVDAASEQTSGKNDYYSKMQDIIGGFMVGEAKERPAYDCVGDIPYVPDLEQDILKHTCMHKNMKPIVERYAALEKVLRTMLDTANISLHPSRMYQMTASEIRSLQSYAKKIKASLAECRTQLNKAHEFLQKQIENEIAEAAEEDES